jgi:hypothetical protein
MVIPSSQNKVPVISDRPHDIRKLARIEAVTIGYRYLRLKPNLGIAATALDMNMSRFGRLALI